MCMKNKQKNFILPAYTTLEVKIFVKLISNYFLVGEHVSTEKQLNIAPESNKQNSCPDCPICLDKVVSSSAATPDCCQDIFHNLCINEWLANSDGSMAKCPVCGASFSSVVTFIVSHNDCKPGAMSAVQPSAQQSCSSDYMIVNQQYGTILGCPDLDISDDDATHPAEISKDRNNEVDIQPAPKEGETFAKDLGKLCQEKANPLQENSPNIKLKVRRSTIWQDLKLKLERLKDTTTNGLVKVEFVGEAAVDEGGPKRELFSLLHQQLCTSILFDGEEGKGKGFAHNLVAALGHEYYLYGLCCALAIINGAVGPQFFCSPVVEYIVHGDIKMVHSSIDSIPDRRIRAKLQQLSDLGDARAFENQVSVLVSELHDAIGYVRIADASFKNKAEILNNVALHYTITQSLCEINQFIDGLKAFGVLDLLRRHPVEARAFLQVSHTTLTAEVVDGLFKFEMPDEGSNRNQNEQAILLNWNQFLEDVEHSLATSTVFDPCTNSQVQVQLSLQSVVAFVTGSTGILPLGF